MRHGEYSETLVDHFSRPRNVGTVAVVSAEAEVESPVHGDSLRLTFTIEGERITDVRFQCLGCVVAIAAGSVGTTLLVGRTVSEALALTDDEIAKALGGVPERKRVCSLIVRRAVRQALAPTLHEARDG